MIACVRACARAGVCACARARVHVCALWDLVVVTHEVRSFLRLSLDQALGAVVGFSVARGLPPRCRCLRCSLLAWRSSLEGLFVARHVLGFLSLASAAASCHPGRVRLTFKVSLPGGGLCALPGVALHLGP
eukprot:10344004-Alexandrium_andersonii.AAC.1